MKTLTITSLLVAASAIIAWADDEEIPFENTSAITTHKTDSPQASISLRFGYHDWKSGDVDIDKSYGFQSDLKIQLFDSPLDLLLRGHYASVEWEDFVVYTKDAYRYYSARVYESNATLISEYEGQIYGGSIQLLLNFRRGAPFNPYVSAGIMYEKDKREYDWDTLQYNRMTLSGLSASWYDIYQGHETFSEDGTAFVGRLGIEMEIDHIYARSEAAYVSKLYGNDSQAELGAVVGAKVAGNVRVEVSGTYFTDWKEFYILGGVTFSF